MSDLLPLGHSTWETITHLGSAGLILPVWLLAAWGVWWGGQRSALQVWGLSLCAAAGLTLITKLMFMGWGYGIAAVNFTGISGHALLATSVLPPLLGALLAPQGGRLRWLSAGLGLALAVLVGVSRVKLGAHSWSEVMSAWLLGTAVSACALLALGRLNPAPPWARLLPLALLLAFAGRQVTYLPTHEWEMRLAIRLSGAEKPFTREQLKASGGWRARSQASNTSSLSDRPQSFASH